MIAMSAMLLTPPTLAHRQPWTLSIHVPQQRQHNFSTATYHHQILNANAGPVGDVDVGTWVSS